MPTYSVKIDTGFPEEVLNWAREHQARTELINALYDYCDMIGDHPDLLIYYAEARPYKIKVLTYSPRSGVSACIGACVDDESKDIKFISVRSTREQAGDIAQELA